MSLLIEKNVFDDYFQLVYKFEYNEIMQIKESEDVITERTFLLHNETRKIKRKIQEKFEKAIADGNVIYMPNEYHRLNHRTNSDNVEQSPWIKTNNKLKLYHYLLFDDSEINKVVLSHCIDYWFEYKIGSYYDVLSRGTDTSINCVYQNIQLVDSIGKVIRQSAFQMGKDACKDMEGVFNYTLKNKDTIYKDLIPKHYCSSENPTHMKYQFFNPAFPTIYKDETEKIDLIQLFDVFFGVKKLCYDQNNFYLKSKERLFVWL